jgi:hypothetical protein
MKLKLGKYLAFALLLWLPLFLQAQSTYLDFGDSVQAWVDARVERAAAGQAEQVEMPLCVRSLGWGCQCPDAYIGASPSTQEGPWIWVEARRRFPKVNATGHSLIVTGSFTGQWKTQDLRNADGEPEEWLYTMPVFKVTSWRKNPSYDQTPAPKVLQQR